MLLVTSTDHPVKVPVEGDFVPLGLLLGRFRQMKIRRRRSETDDASLPVQLGQHYGHATDVVVVRLGRDGEHPLGHDLREEDGVGLGRGEEIAVVVRQDRLEVQRDEGVNRGLLCLQQLLRYIPPASIVAAAIAAVRS